MDRRPSGSKINEFHLQEGVWKPVSVLLTVDEPYEIHIKVFESDLWMTSLRSSTNSRVRNPHLGFRL